MHAQANAGLLTLEANSVVDGGLGIVREGLMEVRQKVEAVLETVYGSDVVEGLKAAGKAMVDDLACTQAAVAMASLETNSGKMAGVETELREVRWMAQVTRDRGLLGSEAIKGAQVVLGGLAKGELNGMWGAVAGWNKDQE